MRKEKKIQESSSQFQRGNSDFPDGTSILLGLELSYTRISIPLRLQQVTVRPDHKTLSYIRPPIPLPLKKQGCHLCKTRLAGVLALIFGWHCSDELKETDLVMVSLCHTGYSSSRPTQGDTVDGTLGQS